MFVPVVTKNMQLFQGQKQPIYYQQIKNVRFRAQSLETNLNTYNANTISTNNNIVINRENQQPQNSQSVGALPTSAQLALVSNAFQSPSKFNCNKKPLDPIVEGVPYLCNKKKNGKMHCDENIKKKFVITDSKNQETNKILLKTNYSTLNLNTQKFKDFSTTTHSSSNLCKPCFSKTKTIKINSNCFENDSVMNKGKNIFKWLSNTFNNKKNCKEQNNLKHSNNYIKNSFNIIKKEKMWKNFLSHSNKTKNFEKSENLKTTEQNRLKSIVKSDKPLNCFNKIS